jgi:protein SYS1
MDWREMAGRPTFRRLHGEERWSSFTGAWSGGRKVAEGPWYMGPDGRGDYMRGWILAACWVLASTAECVARTHSVRYQLTTLLLVVSIIFTTLSVGLGSYSISL